jgi:DNA end-binding protein Ku
MWSGSISFGLVNIPVKLFPGRARETHQLQHAARPGPRALQRKLVCSADGKEVHPEHIVRGYEIAPDQYVIVHDRELENLAPEGQPHDRDPRLRRCR